MPFCHVTLRGQKPPPPGYPLEAKTLGDRLRKRRMDLGLRQKDVAKLLGVDETTVYKWEGNCTSPTRRPRLELLRFLNDDRSPSE